MESVKNKRNARFHIVDLVSIARRVIIPCVPILSASFSLSSKLCSSSRLLRLPIPPSVGRRDLCVDGADIIYIVVCFDGLFQRNLIPIEGRGNPFVEENLPHSLIELSGNTLLLKAGNALNH